MPLFRRRRAVRRAYTRAVLRLYGLSAVLLVTFLLAVAYRLFVAS